MISLTQNLAQNRDQKSLPKNGAFHRAFLRLLLPLRPLLPLLSLLPLLLFLPAYSEQAPPATPSAFEKFFPFLLIAVFFYLILIRPAQKKQQAQNQFINSIKVGDEVLTNGGIYGKVQGITDEFIKLEVAEKVSLRVVKSQVSSWKKPEKPSPSPKKITKASRIKT